jgi:hypothetical protein
MRVLALRNAVGGFRRSVTDRPLLELSRDDESSESFVERKLSDESDAAEDGKDSDSD